MSNLVTIRTFALWKGCTESYIYRLIREGKMKAVEIDGVKFLSLSDEVYQQVKSK